MAALKGILKNDIFFSFGILKRIYIFALQVRQTCNDIFI